MTFAQPRVIGIDELFRLAEEQSMSIRSFESGAAAAAEGVRAARVNYGIILHETYYRTPEI